MVCHHIIKNGDSNLYLLPFNCTSIYHPIPNSDTPQRDVYFLVRVVNYVLNATEKIKIDNETLSEWKKLSVQSLIDNESTSSFVENIEEIIKNENMLLYEFLIDQLNTFKPSSLRQEAYLKALRRYYLLREQSIKYYKNQIFH